MSALTVYERGQAGYEEARLGVVWNGRKPDRHPDAIAIASSEADVVEAVTMARDRGLRIAIRSGGHNFVGNAVRDDGLLLDVSGLNDIEIDQTARTAIAGPGCRSEELLAECRTVGLAFGVGHCPTVAMGGFLLGGGMGFNPCGWGYGCMGVRGVDVVTADGERVYADESTNADLFWAVRGGGPGFFGVVTRFHLTLHPDPAGLSSSTYIFPLECLEEVTSWLADHADDLDPVIEPMVWIGNLEGHVVGDLHDEHQNGHGSGGHDARVFMLNAVAFAETREHAVDALRALEECPVLERALSRDFARKCTFTDLFDFQRVLYPKGLRYAVDCVWTEAAVAEQPLAELREHMRSAPSPRTHALWQLPFAGYRGTLPDMAVSRIGRFFISFYTVWTDEGDDDRNIAWLRRATEILEPITTGHYAGDVDLLAAPGRAPGTLSPANWERFLELRSRFDPEARFHRHLGVGD